MAGSKTGTPTIIKLSRRICKLKALWGASDLQAKTSPGFKTAVDALVVACLAFEALDDYPAEIDATDPYGPEDLPPP